jgi:hypothetical protein
MLSLIRISASLYPAACGSNISGVAVNALAEGT